MAKENKAVELNDEELEKVAGGREPAKWTYGFSIGQKVIENNSGWIYTIIGYLGWDNNWIYDCPKYRVRIEYIPEGSNSIWSVGQELSSWEKKLSAYNG